MAPSFSDRVFILHHRPSVQQTTLVCLPLLDPCHAGRLCLRCADFLFKGLLLGIFLFRTCSHGEFIGLTS